MQPNVHKLLDLYRTRGLLLDTNLLLALVLGTAKPELIGTHRRLRAFTPEDLDLLKRLARHFQLLVTTPNILTELSNLAGGLLSSLRPALDQVTTYVRVATERYFPSAMTVDDPAFPRLGLADVVTANVAAGKYLVVTADLPLYLFLSENRVDAVNFNHLRPQNWQQQ